MELKKYWLGFIQNPVKLFLFFVIVNLLPSIGLIFTEPYNVWGKIILILFPVGIWFCIFSLLRNIGLTQLLLIPVLVIHAFQIVVFYLFGEGVIAVDMFLNVVTTNVSEAGEVLNGVFASVVFVVLVYVPTIVIAVFAFKRKTKFDIRLRWKFFVAGIVFILSSVLISTLGENERSESFTFYEDVYPADVTYNLYLARNKWLVSKKYPETSKDFKFNAVKEEKAPQREIYLLVIGETGRAENWSLYGYERNTTPYLEQDSNIIYFRDAITQSNTTHKSVSIMMSAASAENYSIIYRQKSIIEAYKEVGFSTVFISNQSANRTFTDYFAQEADYSEYYRFFNQNVNNYDEVLLPRLQHYIDSIQGNLFVVLHTYGSHFNYKERYPEEFAVFKPDNVSEISRDKRDVLINSYDNTILYTDKFLHNVSEILEASNSCSAFFYASDHGEDILDDNRQRFLHASPIPTFYQLKIPMFIWFSPVYKDNFPENVKNAKENRFEPVATNSVFHTLLDMGGISTIYFNNTRSLVNDGFKATQRMYLTDHDKPIPFHKVGLKKEDRVMIERRRVNHQ